MNRFPLLILAALAFCFAGCNKYKYETVKGDPLETRIYTLDNGLKVYMSVNKETPRIQTYIAVKVGGKNDPAEATGLAHYFEHLMFKGTSSYGTSDYQTEKPMLDQIEVLFESYRQTTVATERAAIYRQIDSISYEASKLAIPNEYDKLMAAIGADDTNAFTTTDETVYMEDIPANQVENWARIQADRFKNPVIRGFHTELETIYEEKNMSLTRDDRKVNAALDAALYPRHPYGMQTVLGTQESLKNPSITNVKNYHATYYVPNNMAICLSGDFDPDQMIATIDYHFGEMKPNENLPKLQFEQEEPILSPITKSVYGLDAENISLAWRTGGSSSDDSNIAELVGEILYNGKAGLTDININQQQKTLGVIGGASIRPDYGMIRISARPKEGQTLDQVRNLLLTEVAKLRSGEFDEKLLKATLNNYKVEMMRQMESNKGRTSMFVHSFINDIPLEKIVHRLEDLGKITKEQIVSWAQKNLGPENYVAIYKREGRPLNEQKIAKPRITPIIMNRDITSAFVREIQSSNVEPIEPAFVNYKKDMSILTGPANLEILYKENETNGIFTLTYLFKTGIEKIPSLSVAFKYLTYLGTPTRSVAQRNAQMYDIACTLSMQTNDNRTYITITGLSENMGQAMEIVQDLIYNAIPNESVLTQLKADFFKNRANSKLNQSRNFAAIQTMAVRGADYIRKVTLTTPQLEALTSDQLLGNVRCLADKQHQLLYYGPHSKQKLQEKLSKHHQGNDNPPAIISEHSSINLTPKNRVFVAHYDAKQLHYMQLSNRGEKFDIQSAPEIAMFNEYFGGSMNSIVFQEMREARGLAYTANACIYPPSFTDTDYVFYAMIATQNDKMQQAVEAFAEIIENMPESEAAFNVAKEALLARLRTERTVKEKVLWSYIDAMDLGLDTDRNKHLFKRVASMTLSDLKATQERWVKGRTYHYAILGDTQDMDMKYLETLGPVQIYTQEEIFGY